MPSSNSLHWSVWFKLHLMVMTYGKLIHVIEVRQQALMTHFIGYFFEPSLKDIYLFFIILLQEVGWSISWPSPSPLKKKTKKQKKIRKEKRRTGKIYPVRKLDYNRMLTQNLPSLPKHFGYNHVHEHEKITCFWLAENGCILI